MVSKQLVFAKITDWLKAKVLQNHIEKQKNVKAKT